MQRLVDGVHFIPCASPERYAAEAVEWTRSPAVAERKKNNPEHHGFVA
tara:strand:+ start:514 stop:657 length:144 start_codon:yes stop_codon:yes gene_type:complete